MLTQVGEGAAEAVELPDDEHVARPERAHATVESRSVVYAGREVLVDVGVGARMRAGLRASNRRARHLPMRYETGLPSSVIRFRT